MSRLKRLLWLSERSTTAHTVGIHRYNLEEKSDGRSNVAVDVSVRDMHDARSDVHCRRNRRKALAG